MNCYNTDLQALTMEDPVLDSLAVLQRTLTLAVLLKPSLGTSLVGTQLWMKFNALK